MYLVKILISHSYVSLPEGMGFNKQTMVFDPTKIEVETANIG